ncbi:hypothetical protein ACFQ0M_17685 [Kitasatospora aburaviensis]
MTRADPIAPLLLLGADQQHIVTRRSCAASACRPARSRTGCGRAAPGSRSCHG